jgi:hypothetical protein
MTGGLEVEVVTGGVKLISLESALSSPVVSYAETAN